MVVNNCIYCNKKFETKYPKRKFCFYIKCRMKHNYHMLEKKGYDPISYYEQLIAKGTKETCWVCENEFKPTCRSEFFTKMCKECRKTLVKDQTEKFVKEMLKNPRKFLDSVKIKK